MINAYPEVPTMLTIHDLQHHLQVSKNVAYELIRTGQLRAKRVGGQLRVTREDFIRYIRS